VVSTDTETSCHMDKPWSHESIPPQTAERTRDSSRPQSRRRPRNRRGDTSCLARQLRLDNMLGTRRQFLDQLRYAVTIMHGKPVEPVARIKTQIQRLTSCSTSGRHAFRADPQQGRTRVRGFF
jgi:hypothetical protein